MPWKEVTPMDERVNLAIDWKNKIFDFAELCRRYGISRKTGYKWINRFKESRYEGLNTRSSRPHSSPNKTDQRIENAFIELKNKRPDRGAKKLLWHYRKKYRNWPVPSISTVNEILDRNGLVIHRKRRRPQHPGQPISKAHESNELWGIDYKGQFRTRDGNYCYPLTISDYYSRFIICCHGLYSPNFVDSKKVFERVFQEYGLPLRIRTDNGTPFSSPAMGRLSQLSVWWIRLGIFPELIQPGEPQQNSIHERMHRTLKAATTNPPALNMRGQQRKFNEFIRDFNYDRPHESLGQEPPGTVYRKSFRPYPEKLPQIEYPLHFQVRLVSSNGGIKWKANWINVTKVLGNEYIGLEEIDDDIYDVYFGQVLIGRFDEKKNEIISRRTNYSYNMEYETKY